MPEELTSPLLNIVKRLASTEIKGPAAEMKLRFTGVSDVIAVVCDCSGSMLDLVGSSGISKFRHLQIALADLQQGFPKIRLIAFGSIAKQVKSASDLPDPAIGAFGNSTNLAAALQMAGIWKPWKTIVISDGLPDDEDDALEAAANMTGSIDTIYCGPDAHPAVKFLASLSRRTGGTDVVWSGRYEICGVIRGLIAPPE